MASRSRSKKLPKGWPLKDGRPATVEEIKQYISDGDAMFNQVTYATDPHFCQRCTQPLEFEPCPVCRIHFWGNRRKKLEEFLTVAGRLER